MIATNGTRLAAKFNSFHKLLGGSKYAGTRTPIGAASIPSPSSIIIPKQSFPIASVFFIGFTINQESRMERMKPAGQSKSSSTQLNQSTAMNTHISFKPDGTARCLWIEASPLHEIGRLQISTGTNIEFNNPTQHWEVKD